MESKKLCEFVIVPYLIITSRAIILFFILSSLLHKLQDNLIYYTFFNNFIYVFLPFNKTKNFKSWSHSK